MCTWLSDVPWTLESRVQSLESEKILDQNICAAWAARTQARRVEAGKEKKNKVLPLIGEEGFARKFSILV